MLKIAITTIIVCCTFTISAFGNDVWIPHIAPSPVLMPPVVEVPLVPSVTYSTSVQPMPIIYGWVPYRVNKAVVVEKRCLFYRYQYIIYQPTIEWIYQPVYR